MSRTSRKRWGVTALLVVSAQVAVLQATGAAAGAAYAAGPGAVAGSLTGMPSAVPASGTPNIDDGTVFALTQVGSKIIVGGTFTKVSPAAGKPDQPRSRILAFDAVTGALDAGFAPVLDGEVRGLTPGPLPGTVVVAGKFTTVSGTPSKSVALLDTTTGAPVPGFQPPAMNGEAWTVQISGGRLFVGGVFTTVGGKAHGGLATLDPATGALDPYLNVQLRGHHNYTGLPGQAKGAVGPRSFDISPDGTRMIVVGNFTTANGLPRDQIVALDLGATSTVDTTWATLAYTPACYYPLNDSYMRGISFSPDGTFFVVATTGGYSLDGSTSGLCDGAARWETAATGADLRPTWVDLTDGDSLESVLVTDSAVFVGGHQRFINSPFEGEDAAKGAVARPGLAALDPGNGVPLAWNPGRNPRGAGAYALLATSAGLYVGSDTAYIGNRAYLRGRVAYFPSGAAAPETATAPSLPVRICVTQATVMCRAFDGTTVGEPEPLAETAGPGGGPLAAARATFSSGKDLYSVDSTGHVSARTVDDGTLGAPRAVDPYNDPAWENVKDGFANNETYRGTLPRMLTSELGVLSTTFVDRGQLYYTIVGVPRLFSRGFSPDSGTIEGQEHFSDPSVDFGKVTGAFVAQGMLYTVSSTDGSLHSAPFSGGTIDTTQDRVVSGPAIDGIDWRVGRPFVIPAAGAPAA